MAEDKLPDQSYLLEALSYNPETGELHWLERPISHFPSERARHAANRRFCGKVAGTTRKSGYRQVALKGKVHLSHRVIFKMVLGNDPIEIDHINLNKSDNPWKNLREAGNRANNNANTKVRSDNHLGVKRVHFHKETGRFRARIQVNGKKRRLGSYATAEEASAAYCKAALEAWGEFWRG